MVPISKPNARHGSDIKAGDPAAVATGMTRLNSKHSIYAQIRDCFCLSGTPFLILSLTNDIQTYINVFQPAPTIVPCSHHLYSASYPIETFSVKSHIVNILGHGISVTTIQLCCCRTKVVINNSTNECACLYVNKTFLTKQNKKN